MKTLRDVRMERGVKVKAIASHLGISRQTYSKYEARQEKMSVAQAQQVCEYLHCKFDDVFLPTDVN